MKTNLIRIVRPSTRDGETLSRGSGINPAKRAVSPQKLYVSNNVESERASPLRERLSRNKEIFRESGNKQINDEKQGKIMIKFIILIKL